MSPIGFTYRLRMLLDISIIFLPWLNMAASPVPQCVARLPACAFPADSPVRGELGVPLFDRSGRTIRLTDAGESGDSTPAGRYRNWGRVNGRS